MVIEEFVFAEDDGILDFHGLKQHVVSVFHGCRSEHNDPRIMGVNALHALAVERTRPGRAAAWKSNHQRTRDPSSPEHRSRLVHNLVERNAAEVSKLKFDDRTSAF